MSRRTSVWFGAIVLVAGGWGIYSWLDRAQPPPLGDVSIEAVTPPLAELTIRPEKYCDESVPGFWATGRSARSVAETLGWFDEGFGPVNAEATQRLDRGPDGSFRVYDDVEVFARADGSDTFFWVHTYETVGHYCLPQDHSAWDLRNASTFIDACDLLVIEFWGVEYGAPTAGDPPSHWPVLTFDGGEAIAHSIEQPDVIFADDGTGWARYHNSGACYIE